MTNAASIFTAAHAQTRRIVAEHGVSYRVQFAICLRAAYAPASAADRLAALRADRAEIERAARQSSRAHFEGDNMGRPASTRALDKEIQSLIGIVFLEEWTAEETATRRAAWNAKAAKVKAQTYTAIAALENDMGYKFHDLKRAIAHHAA